MRMESTPWNWLATGLALMLAGMPLLQGCANAHAAQAVDNQGRFTVAVGSSEPNLHDLLWVLHEHPPHPRLRKDRGEDEGLLKPTQITLCLYKVEKQGGKMKLVAARDIAYDIDLQDFNQLSPTPKELFKRFGGGLKK